MKILNSNVKENENLSSNLLYMLSQLAEQHNYALGDGWRAIIELQTVGDAEPFFVIDAAANELGGGDFAETKMQTLKMFPAMAATGLDTPEEFAKRLRCELSPLEEEGLDAFAALTEDIRGFARNEHMFGEFNKILRDRLGLTTYRGAIRAPSRVTCTDENGQLKQYYGEIRVSFSGAKEWQDMFMACQLLGAFQHYVRSAWHAHVELSLDRLRQDSQYAMWLNLLEMKNS